MIEQELYSYLILFSLRSNIKYKNREKYRIDYTIRKRSQVGGGFFEMFIPWVGFIM